MGERMPEPTPPAATAAATATTPAVEAVPAVPAVTDPAAQPAPVIDHAAEAEKWKAIARQNELRAKGNADAARQNQAQQELMAKVGAALGFADAAPDPAAITAKLAAAEAESRTRAIEIGVLRAAQGLKVDGDALLDSRQFLAGLAGMDPADIAGIKAAVAAAVAASPGKYGTPTAQAGAPVIPAASTGGQFNGAPGGNRQWTAQDVKNASPAAVTKAMHDGLLRDYMAS
jgi:hypothetical protein